MASIYSETDTRSKRERLGKIRDALVKKRQQGGFDADYRELGEWLMPRRTRFTTGEKNRSSVRNPKIIDSSPRYAARTLESGLHAGLTSPARPWLRLTVADQKLADNEAVKDWLHVTTQRMLAIFQMTNLYQVLPNVYGDTGVFGTGAMAIFEDDDDLFRCFHYPLGSYAVGLNARGIVSTFTHEYSLSVRQVVETFALKQDGGGRPQVDRSKLSKSLLDQWDRHDYENEVDINWIVMPNMDADPDRLDAKFLPFTSCHWEAGANENKLLKDSGFRKFPVMCPRWHVTGGDVYGTDSPGMTALGDVRQLQIQQRRKGQAIAKMIDPPLVGPPQLRTQKTSLLPGDITYVDQREGMSGLRSIHEVTLNIQHLREDTYETRELVRRAFYEDLWLMMTQQDERGSIQPITAREVAERHEEKLIVLGPVLDRMHDELLDPLIDRVWDIMLTAGLIGEPPTELEGAKLRPEYTSVLGQAQKIVGVRALDAFVGSVLSLGATSPEVAASVNAKINFNRIVDSYGDHYSVDPRIILSDEEAQATLDGARQQQEADQMAMRAQALARAGKDAAATPMDGNTALTDVRQAAEQGAAAVA